MSTSDIWPSMCLYRIQVLCEETVQELLKIKIKLTVSLAIRIL